MFCFVGTVISITTTQLCDMKVTTDNTEMNEHVFSNKNLFTDTEFSLHIIFMCITYYSFQKFCPVIKNAKQFIAHRPYKNMWQAQFGPQVIVS